MKKDDSGNLGCVLLIVLFLINPVLALIAWLLMLLLE